MKILAINAGSSSLKFKLFDMKLTLLASGLIEKIGEKISFFNYQKGKNKVEARCKISNHEVALRHIIDFLLDSEVGAVNDLKEIRVIGHRVVHGGDISESCLINQKALKQIEENTELAPLHNPINLEGISLCKKFFKRTRQVAVFDTAFHQTIPEKNYIYPIPYELYEKEGIRKYGFHGISHQYLTQRAAEILKKPKGKINIITCHLGAGCSIAAVKKGKSYDTSMGFTPLEGLMMASRSGDIDPGIVTYLINSLKISAPEVEKILNYKSGLLGVSGLSSDMRNILKNYQKNERCHLALDMFTAKVRKYLGAYMAELGQVDAIIFSGGIGSRSPRVRKMILENLDILGISLDKKKNNSTTDQEAIISNRDSKLRIIVIPSNEEKMIAMEAKNFI